MLFGCLQYALSFLKDWGWATLTGSLSTASDRFVHHMYILRTSKPRILDYGTTIWSLLRRGIAEIPRVY